MVNDSLQSHSIIDKKSLRMRLRQARNQLSSHEQQQHALAVSQFLLSLSLWQTPRRIGFYLSFDGELELMPSIQLLSASHRLFLPRLKTDTSLEFLAWQQDSDLKLNQLGILEPRGEAVLNIAELDVVLMPLVGVDLQGNRLGMGAGFYDRSLAIATKRPYLIGVAHQCQQVQSLPIEDWDIPLDALITDRAITVWHPHPSMKDK